MDSNGVDNDRSGWLTVKAAANRFPGQPTAKTVRSWCNRGIISSHNGQHVTLVSLLSGGRRYIHENAITEFLNRINGQ